MTRYLVEWVESGELVLPEGSMSLSSFGQEALQASDSNQGITRL